MTSSSTGLLTGGLKRNPSGGPVVQAGSKLAGGGVQKESGVQSRLLHSGLKKKPRKVALIKTTVVQVLLN